MRDENEGEESREEILEKYRFAGRILAEIREEAIKRTDVGVPHIEIAEFVERRARDKGAAPAFPCNISVNEEASHATPSAGDETVFKEGDIVKLDMGVHIDGYIADTAVTVDLSGDRKHESLINAAEVALRDAIAVVRDGVRVEKISEVIEHAIKNAGFKPIVNLTGHGLRRFNPHAPPSIPNIRHQGSAVLREGDVVAIEPFATDGIGRVSEGGKVEIYRLENLKPVRLQSARRLLTEIMEFQGLPFAKRWLKTPHPDGILRMLVRDGILHAYPVLREEGRGRVSQAEHTIIVLDDGCEIITE